MARRHVALLRGVNVGGRNRLPMADLVTFFREAGAEEVRTYIQSGNVVFEAGAEEAGHVVERVRGQIATTFGFETPVVLRDDAELERAVRENPLVGDGVDPEALHVLFLDREPLPGRVAALDPERSRPDRFAVVGREVYLYLPQGAGRTKLTVDWFDRQLGAVATGRNWRTILALLDLTRAG